MPPPIALALPLLASAALAQDVIYADGPTSTALTLRRMAETRPGQVVTLRQALELMPIEVTNRTAWQGLRTDVARLVTRRGLRRVELPDGGRLYQYRLRGGQRWGYLWLAADGAPTFLAERNGVGAGGIESPFAGKIGVAPDGRHAAITTDLGRVLAVRLDGTTYPSTGTAWRDIAIPDTIDPNTVSPGTNLLFCGSENDRAWRCSFADRATPVEITPSGSGARLKDEFCLSQDGRVAAFLYGPQRLFSIYVVGETGPALRLPPPPAKYEEPGYLPESQGGPRMMLNDDGSRLLYTDATLRDEIFWLDTTGATPTTHVTGDANFQPYIGIGVFPVTLAAGLSIAVGDPAAFDVYSASTSSPAVVNLTRTNGNNTAPFATGALTVNDMTAAATGALLADVTIGGRREVWRIGSAANTPLVRNVLADLDRASGPGANADFHIVSRDGEVLLSAVDGSTVLAAPPGITLSNSVTAQASAFRMLTASIGPLTALVFLFSDGSAVALDPGEPLDDAVLTRRGLVLDGTSVRYLTAPTMLVTLPTSGPYQRILSGTGTAR